MTNTPTPELRYNQLKTMSPDGIEITGYITTSNPDSIESILHWKYRDTRINGEWFVLTNRNMADDLSEYSGGVYTSDYIFDRIDNGGSIIVHESGIDLTKYKTNEDITNEMIDSFLKHNGYTPADGCTTGVNIWYSDCYERYRQYCLERFHEPITGYHFRNRIFELGYKRHYEKHGYSMFINGIGNGHFK